MNFITTTLCQFLYLICNYAFFRREILCQDF